MADAELRELERAFAASGAVDDEARWLQALLRAGRVDPARLRLPLPGKGFPERRWLMRRAGEEVARLGKARGSRLWVVAELVPWALGRADPVRARVEAR